MTIDRTIFGISFKSGENMAPSQEKLNAFLSDGRKSSSRGLPTGGLENYRRLIEEAAAFEPQEQEPAGCELRDLMLYGVLDHAQFARPALLSAVELYAYHFQALSSLDIETPAGFIKSAEAEMARLNAKRITDVMRMARLREMVEERKKIIAGLKRRWTELTGELRRIALYVRDNLIRVEKVCAASTALLAEPDVGRNKERQLTDSLKVYVKDRVKGSLSRGSQVTQRDLERAKQEYNMLSDELSSLFRNDAAALTRVYGAVLDSVRRTSVEIAVLLADIESRRGVPEKKELYYRIGDALVQLVSESRFEPNLSEPNIGAVHRPVLEEKRKAMLDFLFDHVQRERRFRTDRRSHSDRRKGGDSGYKGPERRSGKDRRAGKGRRRPQTSSV